MSTLWRMSDYDVRIVWSACTGGRKVSTCDITDLPDLLPHLRLNLEKNSRVLPRKSAANIAVRVIPRRIVCCCNSHVVRSPCHMAVCLTVQE